MAVGFPVKADYATGDVLTAAQMNDLAGTLNTVPTSYGSTAGKNVLINGLLDIWQRSTSVTFSASAYNAQDRWYNYASTSSTFARETSVIPTGCTYSCKVTVGASAAAVQSEQAIETLNAAPYAGKTMTLSGYFQSSATPTITFVVYHSSSVDVAVGGSWTAITATSGGSGTAGASSFTRISGVYAIPSTAKSIKVLWYSSSIASAGILYWGGMQFEAGSLPTTLARNAGTLQGELAACMRYYERITAGSTNARMGSGIASSATAYNPTVYFTVPKRIAPTTADYANLTTYDSGIRGLSTLAYSESTNNSITLACTVASGLTTGRGTELISSATGGYIGITAEL
jgi:hypothetical protein